MSYFSVVKDTQGVIAISFRAKKSSKTPLKFEKEIASASDKKSRDIFGLVKFGKSCLIRSGADCNNQCHNMKEPSQIITGGA